MLRTGRPAAFISTICGVALACAVALLASPAIAATAVAGTAPSTLPVPAPQPAELQTLEQRMSELTVNSERFTGKLSFGGPLARKTAALRGLSVVLSGEQSSEPPAARVTTTIGGKQATILRIGSTTYVHEPSLARIDGGRPWIEETDGSGGGLFSSSPSLLKGSVSGGSGADDGPESFRSTAELLSGASEVRSLGAGTVDEQAVVGFAGTIAPGKLAEGSLPKKLLGSLRRKHVKLSARFEVFIAQSGVPVRTSLTLGFGKLLQLKIGVDVLAINFPVAPPAPPPAAETISSKELLAIEKRLLKKLAAKKRHAAKHS